MVWNHKKMDILDDNYEMNGSSLPSQYLLLVRILSLVEDSHISIKGEKEESQKSNCDRCRGSHPRYSPSPALGQGWILIEKNQNLQSLDQGLFLYNDSCWRSCSKSTNNDRISLFTLEEGITNHDLRDRGKRRHKSKGLNIE